jgi:hypothetical protein
LPAIVIPPTSAVAQELVNRAPWWMLPTLGWYVLTIFAGALVASCFMDNDTLRTQMFAVAASGFTATIGFFMGSSMGSQKKDDALVAQAASPSQPRVPPAIA